MGNQNRRATEEELEHVRQAIKSAYPDCEVVFGGHSAYGGHRAPRDHTISFRLRNARGKYCSNVVWLMPERLSSLTPGQIRTLVERSNGKRRR